MKVLYFIQTHKNPEQIYRLIQTIRKSRTESYILVNHDFTACNLDVTPLQSLPKVDVIKRNVQGGRGDFSLVQAYLNAVDWLFTRNIDFDWLINLSVQDYPTQLLSLFEQFLAETKFDGFCQYSDVLSKHSYYGSKESRNRYFYQYWHSNVQLSRWQRGLIKPFRVLLNNTQPFVRVDYYYQFFIGFRAFPSPFSQNPCATAGLI